MQHDDGIESDYVQNEGKISKSCPMGGNNADILFYFNSNILRLCTLLKGITS